MTHCDIIKTMNALKSRVDLRLDQAGRSPPFNVVGEGPATSLFHSGHGAKVQPHPRASHVWAGVKEET